jgi:DNA-binding NtrC family response regulator
LLVDDDDSTRSALRSLLQLDGFEVDIAENGAEALRSMARRVPDVVVTDVQMPELGGRELLLAVKQRFPNVIVVVISGASNTPAELYKDGALAYVSKPFNVDDVVGVLDAALQLRERSPASPVHG